MSHYADETCAVYHEETRRARKAHECSACRETIRVGDRYVSVHIVEHDSAHTVRRCARCQKIHLHLREVCREQTHGEMWPAERLDCGEDYRDHWSIDPPDEIAALAFALPGEVAT